MATIPAPIAFDCEPDSLLASVPCLKCLSEKEMLASLAAILALAASKTNAQVISDSACFTCMSRKEMLQALVTKIANDLLGAEFSTQAVLDQMRCLVCATEKQLLAAILQMLCANFTLELNAQE